MDAAKGVPPPSAILMCGIAGIIDLDRKPIPARLLLEMNQSIAHRGPDDEGYLLIDQAASGYRAFSGIDSPAAVKDRLPSLRPSTPSLGASIGLAHRRFSIIDLSPAGHQPFVHGNGSSAVVFNGEIYNFEEIRAGLMADGVVFETRSDTEVLLAAYDRWGTACFERFNGFWALALYDFKARRLILSRDRLGKKPLHWTKVASRIYFASEIKALLRAPEVRERRRVNEEALYHWLVHGLKDLRSQTFFEGVASLPAASWAELGEDFPGGITTFWSVPTRRLDERDLSVPEAIRGIRTALENAVQLRLRADVPVSVELSGGMDSSTLVALAARQSSRPIVTCTVKFEDRRWDEESFARSVGRRYGVDYRVIEPAEDDFWAQIAAFTSLQEEPYHSPNLQTNQVVWSRMRSLGAKVSLNGVGGDELFAGYGKHFLRAQIDNLAHGRFQSALRNSLFYSELSTRKFGVLFRKIFKKLSGLASSKPYREPGGGSFAQALHADLTDTLMPYWLRSSDRTGMGIPLETRAPFLDFRLIDFAFRLPETYLIRDGWHKWILRKAVEELLPPEVVWRRRKMGFPFPIQNFLASSAGIVDAILTTARNPYLDLSKRNQLRSDWKAISFVLWYEYYFNENTELFRAIEAKSRPAVRKGHDSFFVPQYVRCREAQGSSSGAI